jgi:hypothetical protein
LSPEEAKMKFTKSYMQETEAYALTVEPGEQIDINFYPNGVNAVLGGNTQRALSIRGETLPNGDLVLVVDFNESLLHKEAFLYSGPAWLAVWRGVGAQRAEFKLNKEAPRIDLILEKVDLQALLKPAPEEPSDG